MELENIYNPPEAYSRNPIAYILVGLPGSGKSTWIRNHKTKDDFVVISSDDEIEKYAKSQSKTYSEVFDEYIKTATKNMNQTFQNAVQNNSNIIWDQTNLSKNKRKGIIQKLPKHYKKIAVVFEVDAEELNSRLYNRAKTEGKHIPAFVIDNMKKSYEKPTKDEGFDEILYA